MLAAISLLEQNVGTSQFPLVASLPISVVGYLIDLMDPEVFLVWACYFAAFHLVLHLFHRCLVSELEIAQLAKPLAQGMQLLGGCRLDFLCSVL